MSFLFQNLNERSVRLAFICLLVAAIVSRLPDLSFAQEDTGETVEAAVVEIQEDDDVEEDDFEEVEQAVQVVNAWGVDPNKMVAAKRFHLTQTFLVEIDEIKQVCKLNKKQSTKLRIGAKGAVKKLTAEWKKKVNGQMGQMQPVQRGNDNKPADDEVEIEIKDADEIDENTAQMLMFNGFGGNPYKSDDPLVSRFWTKTVSSVLTEQQQYTLRKHKLDRKTAKRKALIDGTVSCLKVELGLTEDQLVEFDALVRPTMENADMECIALYEQYLIYYYASKVDQKKLAELLSPPQLQKWKIFMAPMKQIGQMMEMEDADFEVVAEEQNILTLLGEVLDAVADGVEALLRVYSR